MEDFSVQLTGEICWLLPGNNEIERFPPGFAFRALAKFTSDFNPSFSVVISYYPLKQTEKDCYAVRLCFPFGEDEEIQRLSLRTEVIILDAYKVIAVCRKLVPVRQGELRMGDAWI